jgi:hypothetical protein
LVRRAIAARVVPTGWRQRTAAQRDSLVAGTSMEPRRSGATVEKPSVEVERASSCTAPEPAA